MYPRLVPAAALFGPVGIPNKYYYFYFEVQISGKSQHPIGKESTAYIMWIVLVLVLLLGQIVALDFTWMQESAQEFANNGYVRTAGVALVVGAGVTVAAPIATAAALSVAGFSSTAHCEETGLHF